MPKLFYFSMIIPEGGSVSAFNFDGSSDTSEVERLAERRQRPRHFYRKPGLMRTSAGCYHNECHTFPGICFSTVNLSKSCICVGIKVF